MLKMQDITYEIAGRRVLSRMSAEVERGSVVAVCGRNGSGKSTLLRAACGLLRPQEGIVSCDEQNFNLASGGHEDLRKLYQTIGYMQQDPVNQLVSTLVFDEVAFGPRNLGLKGADVEERVHDALALVGLSSYVGDEVAALSGGEQQRLALAAVLAMKPGYLLLDEPTSMLDTGLRSSFRALVERLSRHEGIGVLLVTHEPLEVLCADSVIVIEDGTVAWKGSPKSLVREETELWARAVRQTSTAQVACAALLDQSNGAHRLNALFVEDDLEAWCRRHPQQMATVLERASHEASCDGLMRGSDNPIKRPSALDGEPVVDVRGLSFSYGGDGAGAVGTGASGVASSSSHEGAGADEPDMGKDTAQTPVLSSVSFSLRRGEVVLLAGNSGSGKTTLAALLAGLYAPDSGTVLVGGKSPQTGHIAYAFQRPEGQFFLDTVEDELSYALRNQGMPEGDIKAKVQENAQLTGIDQELLPRYPLHLSGGQQRRVGAASALAVDSPLVILDEPTAGMDVEGRRALHGLVGRLAERGRAVLVISHDIEEWAAICDRALLLSRGTVAWEGPASELLQDPAPSKRAAMEPPLVARLRSELVHTETRAPANMHVPAEMRAPDGTPHTPKVRPASRRRTSAFTLIGSYMGQQTPAAALDARVKIALLLAVTVTMFVAYAPLTMMVGVLMLAVCMRAARIDGRALARALRPVGFILVMTVLANMVRIGGIGPAENGLNIGTILGMPVGVSFTGAERGLLAVLRIVMLLGYSVVVSASTTAHGLADACTRLLGPLKRLGVPVGAISTALSLALRFMPLVGEEVERIRLAQRARGASFDEGSLFHRVAVWTSVFAPLVVGLFRRAECIADAMTTRCYDAARGSVVEPQPLSPRDIKVLAGGSLLMAALCLAAQGHLIG